MTWTHRFHCSNCRTALETTYDGVEKTRSDAYNELLCQAAAAGWSYERGWISWCAQCSQKILEASAEFDALLMD